MQWVIYSQINTLAASLKSKGAQVPELKMAGSRTGESLSAAACFGDSRESLDLFGIVN